MNDLFEPTVPRHGGRVDETHLQKEHNGRNDCSLGTYVIPSRIFRIVNCGGTLALHEP
jgi:hypothetical protein